MSFEVKAMAKDIKMCPRGHGLTNILEDSDFDVNEWLLHRAKVNFRFLKIS